MTSQTLEEDAVSWLLDMLSPLTLYLKHRQLRSISILVQDNPIVLRHRIVTGQNPGSVRVQGPLGKELQLQSDGTLNILPLPPS